MKNKIIQVVLGSQIIYNL